MDKGKEMAEYIRRDPAIISITPKDGNDFEKDMERMGISIKQFNFKSALLNG